MPPFFAPLLEPLSIIWLLMVLGLAWLLWRRQWRGAAGLALPTLIIFLLGSTPLADSLVERAERPYAATNLASLNPVDAVVALGGAHQVSKYDLLGFSMSEAGDRILTALQLVRLGKAKNLVMGGSWPMSGQTGQGTMSVVQNWVVAWRLVDGAVTNLGVCIDTHDEAVAFKRLKEQHAWQNVILVTSALHLRRAEAVFRAQGINVTPVGADFQVHGVQRYPRGASPFPSQDRFELLRLYLHERIGWLVYRWRGWI